MGVHLNNNNCDLVNQIVNPPPGYMYAELGETIYYECGFAYPLIDEYEDNCFLWLVDDRFDGKKVDKLFSWIRPIKPIKQPIPDWEQRRYELAKAAMQAYLSNPKICQWDYNKGLELPEPDTVAREIIPFADALIAELKK